MKRIKIITVFFTSFFLYLIVFFFVFTYSSNVPNTSVRELKITEDLNHLLPQSFSFFTVDPRIDKIKIYKLKDTEIVDFDFSQSSFQNKLGVSKNSRYFFGIANQAFEKAPDSLVFQVKNFKQIENMVTSLENKMFIQNDQLKLKHLEGLYVVYNYKAHPYKWRRITDNGDLGGQFIVINFTYVE